MTGTSLPAVRYARTSDGVSIAYMVWPGESPAFVNVTTPGVAPYLAVQPTVSVMESWRRFTRGRALVLFDWRGTGKSDPRPATSMADLVLDLEALFDALGQAPDVVTAQGGTFPACTFVAQHPEACRSLALYNPMVRWSESPQGTWFRDGYEDYESYIYALTRIQHPSMPKADFDHLSSGWARHVPEAIHRGYIALLEAADLSTTLPCIKVPILVYKTLPSSAASQFAALVPGGVLVEREYGGFGQRARADWDEHIGSRFGEAPKQVAAVPDGLLSEQEQRVVALIAEGRTNGQIAEALTIAESTAARHVHNVLTKLGVSNRVEAAAWWLERRR